MKDSQPPLPPSGFGSTDGINFIYILLKRGAKEILPSFVFPAFSPSLSFSCSPAFAHESAWGEPRNSLPTRSTLGVGEEDPVPNGRQNERKLNYFLIFFFFFVSFFWTSPIEMRTSAWQNTTVGMIDRPVNRYE